MRISIRPGPLPPLAAITLAGCASLGGLEHTSGSTRTSLDATTTAWTIAAICRDACPGIDVHPWHKDTLVWSDGDGGFLIEVARSTRGPWRTTWNGRVTAPRTRPGERGFDLWGAVFVPADQEACIGGADERARFRVDSTASGTTRVTFDAVGTPAVALVDRVHHCLAWARAVRRTAELLATGHSDQAERAAASALDEGAPSVSGMPDALLGAMLWFHRALATRDLGREDEARQHAMTALTLDDQRHGIRRWLADLNGRCARSEAQAAQLELLASVPGRPAVALLARRELGVLRRTELTPQQLLARAASLLAAGDAEGARHWVDRARALAPRQREGIALLGKVYRALGQPRRAMETGLLELAIHGYRPDLILALHDDCVALGDPTNALRWLARYRKRLATTHAADLHRRLNEAAARTGERPARRILRIEATEMPATPLRE